MKFKLLFFMAFSMILCACSKDDEPRDVNDSSVTINTNGTTSNGVKFSPIDATSFYLDYVKYEIVDSHIEIVGYDPIEISSEVVPYATIKIDGFTYNTRVIQDNAFEGCSKLEKFVIPNTIQTIGVYAFCNTSLKEIVIPESFTTIDDRAFSGCRSLSSITLPESLETIGYGAFRGCSSLSSITFNESLTMIGRVAVIRCRSRTSLTFQASLDTSVKKSFLFRKFK